MKTDDELAAMTDDERNREFFRFMARHFVALTMQYQTYDNGKPHHRGVYSISGFVVRVSDRHFWITAGHCLREDLDDLIRDKKMAIAEPRFADGFGTEAKYKDFVPLPYEPGCSFAIDDNTNALDFGGIPLSSLTLQNFIANGVVPIGKENWEHQHKLDFEFYKILGIPSHRIHQEIDQQGRLHFQLQPVMVQVEKADPSEANEPVPDGWFVGRIHPDVQIDSIAGMSGGPIYGFRRTAEGRWSYHVVALQSRWWPDTRIIKGCSMPYFAGLLENWIEEVDSSENE